MRDTGGRASRRLWAAVALGLLLVPLFPVAPAQSPSDPWWGASDRTQPTQGLSVRVPITVENKFDYRLIDAYVAAEIDFGKLLVEAGWTNETRGAATALRGFTLDVDSIRVVPYARGFVTGPLGGAAQQPIPHVFYPSLFEAPKFSVFNASTNPAGTILFQIEGDLRPQEKRDFYVYAQPAQFPKAPPSPIDPVAKGALDAFLWGTTGTLTYGYEPMQTGQKHVLSVRSLAESGVNRVTLSTLELGRFVPAVSTPTYPNPLVLQGPQGGQFYVPAGKPYRIESDRPVRVMAFGQAGGQTNTEEAAGFASGVSGSFADDRFQFDAGPGGPISVRLIKVSPGTVSVKSTFTNGAPQFRELSTAAPTTTIPVDGVVDLEGTGKFLVSFRAAGENPPLDPPPFAPVQLPSTFGGPSGTGFFSFLVADNGYLRVCPDASASLRMVELPAGTVQLYPEGTLPNVPPAQFEPGLFCEEIRVPRTTSARAEHEYYSIVPEGAPPGTKPGAFRMFVGSGERFDPTDTEVNLTRPFLGHYGGLAGVDYDVFGATGLFGFYNETSITISEERMRADGSLYTVNSTRGLKRDDYVALTPSSALGATGRYHITATKPISATSLAPAVYREVDPTDATAEPFDRTIPYLEHIPGRPIMPSIAVGRAEFRGPLLDIRSPTNPDRLQDFLTTGPGSPVSYRLDVRNLGRWLNGEDLLDTITIACSTPAGWRVEGCAKEVTLGSRSSERLTVTVTPPDDIVRGNSTILVEARSRLGGVPATFKLQVIVETRYGVGMWFDVEDGRKTIDPPIGLEPGATHEYNIVLKNTGSATDTFELALDDPREGWTQSLLLDGAPVESVRLDGGQTTVLKFRVKAPNAETAPQNIVSIVATSQSSALAADVVNTATRIRPKVDLELNLTPQTRLAEPGETVLFNISTRNKGNDVFTVIFEQDSILPKGWVARLSVPEITLNPNPTNDPALNYVLQLFVTPPPGARAGDLASVKLAAEIDTGGAGGRVAGDEISAVVVVRRVYNLTVPPIADAEALPGAALRFVLPITNLGNGQVSLELLPGAVEAALILDDGDARVVPGWTVTLEVPSVTLELNETTELPLALAVPNGTPPGLYNVTFTTRLSRETLQNLTLPVNVQALSRVEFVGPTSLPLVPGRAMTVGYSARNTGNVEGSFDLRVAPPADWNASVSPARARLAPGERIDVVLTLNASRDAANGEHLLRLESRSAGASATPTEVRVGVARPQLYLSDVSGTGDLRAGELVLVSATIGNRGSIEATNVSVALSVDGNVVDRVLLSRVPVGASSVATMSWVATQRGGEVKVVLDPDQEISLPTREETEAEVEFGSRLGIPAPGALVVVILLGVLALAGGKERGRRGERDAEDSRMDRVARVLDPLGGRRP